MPKCAIALWEARARAERPPLWGSDDVSAMRNYRYRHRDSPYVARRSGERTSRAGRPWAVGGELPGARWRGRPVCAMRPAVKGAAAAQTRACRFFSSTSHPRLRRAGRRRGGKADRSVQRPVILVRCVGHGGGARGVGAVRRHARGGARGTGRAGQRGERCAEAQNALRSGGYDSRRGVKPIAQLWTTIGAAEPPFAPPWASALSERPFRPRRKPRAPVRMWPQRPG